MTHPYHEGELQVQERVGVLTDAARNSRLIQRAIAKGALRFLPELPMVVVGSLDHDRHIWASVFMGAPGLLYAKDDRTVVFDFSKTTPNPHDPFWVNTQVDRRIGMLAIDLASRRRLRVNGTVVQISKQSLTVQVEESYANCPKYIQRRQRTIVRADGHAPIVAEQGSLLGCAQRAIIAKADTFFVASAHLERGVDASHRGGNPGFVRIINEHTLCIPDYPGNAMFNTLGNLTVNPRAGLLFWEFESRKALQLTGTVDILYDVNDTGDETGGTNRWWQFHIDHWVETTQAAHSTWELLDYSPYNP